MNEPYNTLEHTFGYALSGAERNRVLRNTYWLLAISMVPTILGAWIGVETGFAAVFNGMLGFVLMLEGGVPIMKDGQCLGAVGVSGVKSPEDAQIARAGIAAIGL